MIKIVEGDLLEAEEDVIVHQVNTRGVMGSGVALQVKKKHHVAYEEYVELCHKEEDREDLLGHVQMVKVGDNKYIANLFGQLSYGYDGKRHTSYDALYSGLEKIKRVAQSNRLTVAIPYRIGSDRGGADWKVVYAMIESIFHDHPVVLYKLKEA